MCLPFRVLQRRGNGLSGSRGPGRPGYSCRPGCGILSAKRSETLTTRSDPLSTRFSRSARPYWGGEVRNPWDDRIVRRPPIAIGLEVWAKALGCVTTPRMESDTGSVRTDTYPGPVQFRVMTIQGLGHHWPGGKGRLNPRIAGPPSDTVNGTELVWEFFKQHRLQETQCV